jgi:MoaA/NifB/PqqE/SkfB family radical SAM enzyme
MCERLSMIQTNEFNADEKILNYIDKLNYFFNADKTLIVTELDLTNHCNNRCPACVGKNGLKDELKWDEIQSIAKSLSALNNRGVILSGGGEPLLHPRFIETVQLLKSYNIKIGVNSNCLALDKDKAVVIAENCDYFRVSLDAGNAYLYKKTHGMDESSFQKVIENIRLMVEVKRKLGSRLSFGTGFLTSHETVDHMEAFVCLSKECGVDFAQFRPFQEDMTDITEKYKQLKSIYEANNFKVLSSLQKYNNFNKGKAKGYDKCRGMFFSTVITANARLYACLHYRQNDDYLIGDLRQGKTLEQIWSSYKKWYLYDTIDVHNCPSFCRNDCINMLLFNLSKTKFHNAFL